MKAYFVWLDAQVVADMALGSWEEVEALFIACHEGRDHPISENGEHRHATGHEFGWSERLDGEAEPSQMYMNHCAANVAAAFDWEDRTDEELEASCRCRTMRPLLWPLEANIGDKKGDIAVSTHE